MISLNSKYTKIYKGEIAKDQKKIPFYTVFCLSRYSLCYNICRLDLEFFRLRQGSVYTGFTAYIFVILKFKKNIINDIQTLIFRASE